MEEVNKTQRSILGAEATPQKNGGRKTLMDTVDPERGNCLMLFRDKMDILNMMPENEQCDTFILLKRWFEGEEEYTVMQEANEHTNPHQVATALRIFMCEQKRQAKKFIDYCRKQQQRKIRNRNPNGNMKYVPTCP